MSSAASPGGKPSGDASEPPNGSKAPHVSDGVPALRRSRDGRDLSGALLGAGIWLVIGVFSLHGPVASLAGARAAWAHVAAGVVLAAVFASRHVLQGRTGGGSGSFQSVASLEHRALTYAAGWVVALGTFATGALLASTVVAGLQPILVRADVWTPPDLLLAGVIVLAFALASLLGLRWRWGLAVLLVAAAGAAIVLITMVLTARALSGQPSTLHGVAPPTPGLYQAVALLISAAWVLELSARRFGTTGWRLGGVVVLAGPALAAAFELSARSAEPSVPGLSSLLGVTLPGAGPWVPALGSLAAFAAWQVVALLSGRELRRIGSRGVFPAWFTRRAVSGRSDRFAVVVHAGAALGILAAASVFGGGAGPLATVAGIAAFAFLLLQLTVSAAAVVSIGTPADGRASGPARQVPLLAAIGAALSFLLLLALPSRVWLLSLAWLVPATATYLRNGRERMREAEVDYTLFESAVAPGDGVPVPRDAVPDNGGSSAFPIVVAVRDPRDAEDVLAFAAAVASRTDGHLVLVEVVEVPAHLPLGTAALDGRRPLDDLDRLTELARTVPGARCEAVTRLARSAAQGILDTAEEECARLIVLGWAAHQRADGLWLAGSTVDAVHARASCAVALVRGNWRGDVRRVLVPVAGGPNAPLAAARALDLTAGASGSVTLLSVTRDSAGDEETSARQMLEDVRSRLAEPERAHVQVVHAPTPLHGIREAMREHDAVMLGATEPSILEPMVSDPLPLRLASEIDLPLATLRGARGQGRVLIRQAWLAASTHMPLLSADEQRDLLERMRAASRPSVNYYTLVVLSAVIATLGLLLDSTAVIIGAMLVAPLMGPIMSSAAGVTFGRLRTLEAAVATLLKGALLAVFVAIVTAIASPLVPATSEVMARTAPNLLDLLVALASGAAGAYVLARREVGEALPGVAIAAALMPPLCVVGIGSALVRTDIATGALLLFAANLVAIVFAACLVFLLLGVRPPPTFERERQLRRGLAVSLLSLVAISLPLAIALARTVRNDTNLRSAERIVETRFAEWGARAIDGPHFESGRGSLVMEATVIAEAPPEAHDVEDLRRQLTSELDLDVTLRLSIVTGRRLEAVP